MLLQSISFPLVANFKSKDAARMKPLIDIWANSINNEDELFNIISDKKQKDKPVELTFNEKIALYNILGDDNNEVLKSYIRGKMSNPGQVMKTVKF